MKAFLSLTILVAVGVAAGCSNTASTNVAVKNSVNEKPAATHAPATPRQDEGHDAPRISLADAKKAFDEKSAVFIDTHPQQQFDSDHIVGAINIQANTIKQNLDKIPRGKKIIVYCS